MYEIICQNCEMLYIGQTRSLQGRITLHKSDSRLYPERCALASHVCNEKHVMNYGVLQSERNLHKRLFLEMAFPPSVTQ